MKTPKILRGFNRLSDVNLENQANGVIAAITGNAYFPDNEYALVAFNTATKNFSEALAASQTRDKVKVAAKNSIRRLLELAMAKLADYATYHANGDRVILISSGFPVNAEGRNSIQLGVPQNFTVQLGRNPGEVVVGVNRVKGAKAYVFFYAPAPVLNNAWLHTAGTSSRMFIDGLKPVTEYCFWMSVAGTKGQMAFTDTVTRLVI